MPEHNIRNVDEMLSSSVAMLEVLVLEGLLIDYVDIETIGTYINHIKNNQLIVAQIVEQCIK